MPLVVLGFMLWVLWGRCSPNSFLKCYIAPVWFQIPIALPVPLLSCWMSQGCIIPVLRDSECRGPTGIQHPPLLPPGLSRILGRGKNMLM